MGEGQGRHLSLIQDKDKPMSVRITTRREFLDKIDKLVQSRTKEYELNIFAKIFVNLFLILAPPIYNEGFLLSQRVKRQSSCHSRVTRNPRLT